VRLKKTLGTERIRQEVRFPTLAARLLKEKSLPERRHWASRWLSKNGPQRKLNANSRQQLRRLHQPVNACQHAAGLNGDLFFVERADAAAERDFPAWTLTDSRLRLARFVSANWVAI